MIFINLSKVLAHEAHTSNGSKDPITYVTCEAP